MYIQPAEYLDLTDRITVLTHKYQQAVSEKQYFANQLIASKETIRMLEKRITQLEKEQQKTKEQFKEQIAIKADEVIKCIKERQEHEKVHIEQQVSKLRNDTALNKLKLLEEKITQNQLNSEEKSFCQKVKTLFIIENKKAKCSYNELFEWVSKKINDSKFTYDESFFTANDTSRTKGNKPPKKDSSGSKKQLPTIKQSKQNSPVVTSYKSFNPKTKPEPMGRKENNSADVDILSESKSNRDSGKN